MFLFTGQLDHYGILGLLAEATFRKVQRPHLNVARWNTDAFRCQSAPRTEAVVGTQRAARSWLSISRLPETSPQTTLLLRKQMTKRTDLHKHKAKKSNHCVHRIMISDKLAREAVTDSPTTRQTTFAPRRKTRSKHSLALILVHMFTFSADSLVVKHRLTGCSLFTCRRVFSVMRCSVHVIQPPN